MRKNKYNESAAIILLVIGIMCIIYGIAVQILLKDSNDITSYTFNSLESYMLFGGIICTILGIIMKVSSSSRNSKISDLKSSGKLVYATNLRVWKNYYWGVDKRHWCYLFCDFEDPVTHQKYEFRSDKLWVDIEPIIAEKKINKIPVYIDSKNSKNYFVDVDELTATNISTNN